MADDLSPDDVRTRSFGTSRRGYDRAEVDAFRVEIASLVETLTERIGTLERNLQAAGVAEVRDLEAEFAAVADEVGAILQAAREAAAQMRSRAATDAARWRAEADEESRAVRKAASADAEMARRSAWETGTEMLTQAVDESDRIIHAAEQDALFIRAEAEREALRLTGDARRDREEEVRAARTQAERMLIDARAESEAILETARQSAEAAQERARALELRRADLMEELESARRSIGQLEQEIDTRREALQYHGAAEPSGMRVISAEPEPYDEEVDYGAEWLDEDMAVRVVPVTKVPEPEPVDAEAFIAEVMEMRSKRATGEPDTVEPDTVEPDWVEPDMVERDLVEPESAEPDTGAPAAAAEPPQEEEPPAAVVEVEAEPAAEPEDAVESGSALDAEPAVAERPSPPRRDELTSLFASLRTEAAAVPDEPPAPEPAEVPESTAVVGDATAGEPETVEQSGPPAAPAGAAHVDPFELRDRLLIPIENRALRSVKRRLVDMQNRVLEDVRVAGEEWVPDETMLTAAFGDDVARLAQEALVAGYAGAADLAGADRTPQPSGDKAPDATRGLVTGLSAAIAEAAGRARNGGAGARQLSAAVSRVFRAWRTDEAERRLRLLCHSAYHDGLLRAFPDVGVTSVVGVAPGHPCGECPAGTGLAWTPGEPLPVGRAMPPAVAGCRCTIVPAEA